MFVMSLLHNWSGWGERYREILARPVKDLSRTRYKQDPGTLSSIALATHLVVPLLKVEHRITIQEWYRAYVLDGGHDIQVLVLV